MEVSYGRIYQFLYLNAQLMKNYLNSMIRFWKIKYRSYKGPNIPSVTFVCFERLWSHEKMTPVVPCFFLTFITLRLCDPQDFTIAGRFPVLLLYMSCVCVQHLFTKIQGVSYGIAWKVNKQKYYPLQVLFTYLLNKRFLQRTQAYVVHDIVFNRN